MQTTEETRPPVTTAGLVAVNGAQLYHEVRGSGPAVLFIAGGTGDGGQFARVADLLAGDFTIVTYDRRGNSRSPRPAGWHTTSTDEQADDAAGLLGTLGLAPAVVVGTSHGAIIGLNLLLRHPAVVRGAILHDPPLLAILDEPQAVMAVVQPIVEGGMARGGPRGAVEAFLRFAAGDATFEAVPPPLRERMLGNGETLFGIEFGTIDAYRPDDATLAAVQRPVVLLAGTDSPPFMAEAARRLAARLRAEVAGLPGGHMPYLDRPETTAAALRPFMQRMW